MNVVPETVVRIARDSGDLTRRFWVRYERHVSSLALIGGFIVDYLTLTRIDRLFDNLVLLSYLLVVAIGIILIHFYQSPVRFHVAPVGTWRERLFNWLQLISPTIIQFAIGGTFSGFVVFYSRSATLAGSWPFLLVLVALLVGNEFLKTAYRRMTMQVGVLYFALLSYTIFSVPVLIGSIGWWVFLLSGVVSLVLITGFISLLRRLVPERFIKARRFVYAVIAVIFIGVNSLYFANIIPPIPLSLKDAGAYLHVARHGDAYVARSEADAWYEAFRIYDDIRIARGEPIYVFSSVFAPSDLKTDIIHRWQHYSEREQQWVTKSTVRFPLIGGRNEGYRGYSLIRHSKPGYWRTDILTPDGRLIGRIPFVVEITDTPPETTAVEL